MDTNVLRRKIQFLIDAQGRNIAELSEEIGKSRGYLSEFVDRNGTEDPSFGTMSLLAKKLGVSLSYFDEDTTEFEITTARDIDREAATLLSGVMRSARARMLAQGARPTMDCIVSWWQENGGRLINCEALLPYVDLVSSNPNEAIPAVAHVGHLGLSAETLKSQDVSKLQSFIDTLDEADMAELKKTISTVRRIVVGMVTPQSRTVPASASEQALKVDFVRLMLPVTDAKGDPYVLNFSTLLSLSSPRKQSVFSV
jgi:transcriptional regulator with XRE-family HTH domain